MTEPPPPFEATLTVRERRPVLSALQRGLPLLLAVVGIAASAYGTPAIMFLMPMQVISFGVGIRARWRSRVAPARTKHARVRADRRGLFFDDVLAAPASAIASGYVALEGEGAAVRLFDARGNAFLEVVCDERTAADLAATLQLDAGKKRVRFDCEPGALAPARRRAWIGATIAANVALTAVGFFHRLHMRWNPMVLAVLGVLSAFVLVVSLLPWWLASHVDVAADGLGIVDFGVRRFVRSSDVRAIEPQEEESGPVARVTLADGTHIDLRVAVANRNERNAERDALVACLRAAFDAYASAASSAGVLAERLARSGRSVDAWGEDLRRGGAADGGYRDAILRDEDLWRLIEDPGAPADARAAAAVVLARAREPDARARLRVAAEAVAEPKLRVAFEAAADGEPDDALDAFASDAKEAAHARRRG